MFNIICVTCFRHCQRFLPIGGSCYANNEDIKKLASEMFQSTFFAEDTKPSTVRRYYHLITKEVGGRGCIEDWIRLFFYLFLVSRWEWFTK